MSAEAAQNDILRELDSIAIERGKSAGNIVLDEEFPRISQNFRKILCCLSYSVADVTLFYHRNSTST
jgi:hypothetical protein